MTPATLYPALARTEAVTWALLLLGMVLKYVTRTTELGVAVFGLVHGVVFLAYVLVTVVVALDQRWTRRMTAAALVAALPPFATLWVERRVERSGRLATSWRLAPGGERPAHVLERGLARALSRPVLAAVLAGALVLVATAALLVVGPPGGRAGA
ncbi:DUF3817 domain-containing protein [Phycicoccus sp. MAQZ13P-2]|uniref:DUF3817 domain-containing protein n=1 Tax=Phycicoccus mangrovi TaxID=2840470 RepID=UPI001C008E46|nr:DUF3817 domain-containing protein [Phycicoccus mangrovi]MBT9256773.1 DUF3817 domain-containing protein [Phycicoccus mangrovi]MBT9274663.1 DUF3817 domain-containing protein [Phycicoccus mangrovi]